MSRCRCWRCRHLPEPIEVGDAHEVAVVLHLDFDSAHAIAGALGWKDTGAREVAEAADRWQETREAMES